MKRKIIIVFLLASLLVFNPGLVSAEVELNYTGYGGNRTLSGSLHIVEVKEEKIMLDAGSFFEEEGEKSPALTKEVIEEIEAVIISHAHTDHIGRLPKIVELGYDGPIYTSGPTAELMEIMFEMALNYSSLGEEEFYYSRESLKQNQEDNQSTAVHSQADCWWKSFISSENKKELKLDRSQLAKEDFYICSSCRKLEAAEIIEQVKKKPAGKYFSLTDDLEAKFYPTPHIPGSVVTKLKHLEKDTTVVYTGDFGSGQSPYLAKPKYPKRAQWAIVEGTYDPQRSLGFEQGQLVDKLAQYLEENKRIVIAAPVLARTQLVLGEISRAKAKGAIPPDTEVKLLGSTAPRINKVYTEEFSDKQYSQYFSREFKEEGFFLEEDFEVISKLDKLEPKEIIITSPATAQAGYSKELVTKYLEDEKTAFIFTTSLSPEVLGGRLYYKSLEGAKELAIDDNDYKLEAEVAKIDEFSSHGTFKQISSFLSELEGLEGILIVHSREETAFKLKEEYEAKFPEWEVLLPKIGRRYQLNE